MTADAMASMVEAFEAIPAQCNPHVESARRHLDLWVVEHGLIERAAAKERFGKADFGWFAAVTYPTAGVEELALVADWFAWLFLLDDQLDDGLLGKDRGEVGNLMGAIFDVLNDRGADPAGPSIVTALADLWRRTVVHAGPSWRTRFIEHVVAGGMAAVWEADNRVCGTVPSEAEYIEKRRHTGAIYVCMDLIEIVEHIDIPSSVFDSDPFARTLRAACDVVCWTNDLYSLDKEISLGEFHNLVPVVQQSRGPDRAEAVEIVAGLITERLDDYLGDEPTLPASSGGTAELAAYAAGMRSWMRGNLEWSASTRRYRDSLPDSGNPAEYLERALVGRTDQEAA